MLAQSFLSHEQLGITEPQLSALQKTLVLLETGKLAHIPVTAKFASKSTNFTGHFNMAWWSNEHGCGTVGCIGGTAEMIGEVKFARYHNNKNLSELFEPYSLGDEWDDITPAQAATALRSYLTTGDAKWSEAVA